MKMGSVSCRGVNLLFSVEVKVIFIAEDLAGRPSRSLLRWSYWLSCRQNPARSTLGMNFEVNFLRWLAFGRETPFGRGLQELSRNRPKLFWMIAQVCQEATPFFLSSFRLGVI
jgi:hypothetical protein